MLISTITGNLGRDAELKRVKDRDVCEFSVAVKTSFKKDDPATWVRCAIWGNRALAVSEHLTKGTRVTVVGKQTIREYKAKTGEARHSVEFDVLELEFSGGGTGAGEGRSDVRSAPAPAPSPAIPASQPDNFDYEDTNGIPF